MARSCWFGGDLAGVCGGLGLRLSACCVLGTKAGGDEGGTCPHIGQRKHGGHARCWSMTHGVSSNKVVPELLITAVAWRHVDWNILKYCFFLLTWRQSCWGCSMFSYTSVIVAGKIGKVHYHTCWPTDLPARVSKSEDTTFGCAWGSAKQIILQIGLCRRKSYCIFSFIFFIFQLHFKQGAKLLKSSKPPFLAIFPWFLYVSIHFSSPQMAFSKHRCVACHVEPQEAGNQSAASAYHPFTVVFFQS